MIMQRLIGRMKVHLANGSGEEDKIYSYTEWSSLVAEY